TNSLVDISDKLLKKNVEAGKEAIEKLFGPYRDFVQQLFSTENGRAKGNEIIDKHYEFVKSYAGKPFTEKEQKVILAEGELISTQLFQEYLVEAGHKSVLLPALEFMKIDEDNEPMLSYIED